MALDNQVKILGIEDCKIAKVTVNTSSTYTVDTSIDVPGIQEITLEPNTEEKICKGDEVELASTTLLTGYKVTFKHAVLDMAIKALINGSTLSESGITPDQVTKIEDGASDDPATLQLQFKVKTVDGQATDYHRSLYCVKGYLTTEYQQSDYAVCSFNGRGFARMNDKKFGCEQIFETTTQLFAP